MCFIFCGSKKCLVSMILKTGTAVLMTFGRRMKMRAQKLDQMSFFPTVFIRWSLCCCLLLPVVWPFNISLRLSQLFYSKPIEWNMYILLDHMYNFQVWLLIRKWTSEDNISLCFTFIWYWNLSTGRQSFWILFVSTVKTKLTLNFKCVLRNNYAENIIQFSGALANGLAGQKGPYVHQLQISPAIWCTI